MNCSCGFILAETEANLAVHTRKLSEIESEIATLAPLQKKFTLLKSQLELKTYDLSLFEGQAEQSEHYKLAEAVVSPTSELQNENKELVKKDEEHQERLKTVEALKKSLKDHGQDLLLIATTIMNTITQAQETGRERLIMGKDAVIQEMQALGIELSTSQQQITKLEEAIGEVEAKRDAVKQEYLNANEHLNLKKEKMKKCNVQIGVLVAAQGDLSQKLADISLQAKRLDNEQLFGKPGTDYDFAACDAQAGQQELEVFLVEQKNNEKRVNKKADALFGKPKEESKELLKKREIVQVGSPNPELTDADAYHVPNDKSKDSEDDKEDWLLKKLSLLSSVAHRDFGSIFSMLLPGTMAKLESPEGGDSMDGLEVRVAFGGVWKQSLSELSGGQRSFSLMGEVVSELQFIVVSLKEGMFNNANVIFCTKFVDGVSTVTRTVPSGSQAPSEKQKAANEQMSQGKVSLFLFIMSIST
ncbi:unnamed protein product [Sphagnum balticum]